ncbi:MAG TPA: M56 family metallopeptidase, partial [Verrucomicrobiae bacterium]|nr:M56 family metallopeptidase [Verrucomicrobiae bacterium]
QQVVAAVCFFNPAIWWLSRRLTIDREIACDDHALAGNRSPQDYALLLTEFAGRSRGNDWIAAPAAWSSKSQLKERIDMILDSKRNTSSRLARTSTGALTVVTMATAAMALLAGPRLVLAASADQLGGAPSSSAATGDAFDTVAAKQTDSTRIQSDPFGAATAGVASSDAKPKEGRTRSTITLRNGGRTITAPVQVETEVETHVDVADVHPRIVIAHAAPAPEPPEKVRPPSGPKPPVMPVPSIDVIGHPVPPDRDRDALERRLERLERQLEKLTAKNEFQFKFAPGEPQTGNFVWKEKSRSIDKSREPGEVDIRHEEIVLEHPEWPMNEEQQRAVEKAMKDAEAEIARAMKEAEWARRDAGRQARMEARISRDVFSKRGPEFEQQRKILEQQRQALQKQMERLDREMNQLDEQMNRLDDQLDEPLDVLEEEIENRNVNEDSRDADRQPPRVKEKQSN